MQQWRDGARRRCGLPALLTPLPGSEPEEEKGPENLYRHHTHVSAGGSLLTTATCMACFGLNR